MCPTYQLIPGGSHGYYTAVMIGCEHSTVESQKVTRFHTSTMSRNLLIVKVSSYDVVGVICPQCEREVLVVSNYPIIDLLVPPRSAGVAGTFLLTLQFYYTTTLAARRIFYLPNFNSLYTHKGPVLLCAPTRHSV